MRKQDAVWMSKYNINEILKKKDMIFFLVL